MGLFLFVLCKPSITSKSGDDDRCGQHCQTVTQGRNNAGGYTSEVVSYHYLVNRHLRCPPVDWTCQTALLHRILPTSLQSMVVNSVNPWWNYSSVPLSQGWSLRSASIPKQDCAQDASASRSPRGADSRWELRWDFTTEEWEDYCKSCEDI